MKRVLTLAVLLIAAPAAADPVTVSSGNQDAATLSALTKVRGQMAVCWQRKPPASVTIKLAVGKDGKVTKATAKTKGGAAQCAAGILAVSTLAPSAKAWKGTIAIASDASGKANDARLLNDALVAGGDALRGCQSKEPAFEGQVTLRIEIGADGALKDATATVADGTGGAKVASCVAAAAKKLTYPALSNALTYDLAVQFAGGGAATTTATDDITGGAQPSKKGPLDGDAALAVIEPKHAALRACGKKGKAHGKVVVRIAIGADGKVTKSTIKSSELNDSAIEDCVVAVFKKLSFPTADGETVIQYPLVF